MIKVVLFDYGRVLYGPLLPQREVWKMARDIRARGINTGILSNTVWGAPWVLRRLRGYRGFEPVVLSSYEGVAKPDPEIYETAIARSESNPGEIIFIDNRQENIAAAQKLGMKTVLAKNSNQVVADVKKILLDENGLKL